MYRLPGIAYRLRNCISKVSFPNFTNMTTDSENSDGGDKSEYFSPKKRQKVISNITENDPVSRMKRLDAKFYGMPCETLAKCMLGKTLVRILNDGTQIRGKIVETESYLGGEDKASQSFGGKKTPRNEPMFMKPGTAYLYMTYGMYFCFNISSQAFYTEFYLEGNVDAIPNRQLADDRIERFQTGEGAAVLIRAVEPIMGLEEMRKSRGAKRKDNGEGLKIRELSNGPSKLCQAFQITIDLFNKEDLTKCPNLWLEDADPVAEDRVVETTRIGIGPRAEIWAMKPLRFYIGLNEFVSKRDKAKEKEQFRND